MTVSRQNTLITTTTSRMRYGTKDYERFLLTEIDTQIRENEDVVNTRALVLKARGDVFVGRFLSMHANGSAIFKVRNSDDLPRKGSFWTACYLIGEMGSFKQWGSKSWLELRKDYQRTFSECSCQWISKSDNPEFCLVGIKGLSLDFVTILETEQPIIAFGPKDPPLEYLYNLLDIIRNPQDDDAKDILHYQQTHKGWNPQLVAATDDLTGFIEDKLSVSNLLVIQGPPGTGKTYRMAGLAAKLMNEGYSVLVTALTNQALMELAKKEDLEGYLQQGRVSKTSLTYDESKAIPALQNISENKCNARKGYLTLASFYVSSRWAKASEQKLFDYVIMDEASQALLPMIAASRMLGAKVILIGDQNQLSPIVVTNDDEVVRYGWQEMISGFKTICTHFDCPAYMLKDTFRLTSRAATFTGYFYDGLLESSSKVECVPSKNPMAIIDGGPVLIPLPMERGNKACESSVTAIVNLVDELRRESPQAEIAVLSKFRESARKIMRGFLNQSSIGINDNLRVDTVDKVQGLTVDYCIFFIPNASVRHSLDEELFNVATSRARYNTFIVADSNLLDEKMAPSVRKYLCNL